MDDRRPSIIGRYSCKLFIVVALFLSGCISNYISDQGMMSAVEAFVPEAELSIDGNACLTTDNKQGACSIIREEGSDIRFDIMTIPEAEIIWKSNCIFLYNGERTN